jgi:hypothetical protein
MNGEPDRAQRPLAGTRLDIDGSDDEILVGADPDCRLALDLPGVSPIHARLSQDQGELIVHDTRSPRGVYVNDTRVTGEAPLRDGDVLWLGRRARTRASCCSAAWGGAPPGRDARRALRSRRVRGRGPPPPSFRGAAACEARDAVDPMADWGPHGIALRAGAGAAAASPDDVFFMEEPAVASRRRPLRRLPRPGRGGP